MAKIADCALGQGGLAVALKRIIVLCSVSMLMGGCSNLMRGSGQYASLPAVSTIGRVPDVVIPGTPIAQRSSQHGRGTDPLVVLQRTASAKADHKNAQVPIQNERAASVNQPRTTARSPSAAEPTSTASIHNGDKSAAQHPAESYDRDVAMDRLVKGGQTAAKPICTGC